MHHSKLGAKGDGVLLGASTLEQLEQNLQGWHSKAYHHEINWLVNYYCNNGSFEWWLRRLDHRVHAIEFGPSAAMDLPRFRRVSWRHLTMGGLSASPTLSPSGGATPSINLAGMPWIKERHMSPARSRRERIEMRNCTLNWSNFIEFKLISSHY